MINKFKTFLLTALVSIVCVLTSIAASGVSQMGAAKDGTIVPKSANMQSQWFPVFVFEMPEGYTDFELKGSVTNFIGSSGNTDSHDGTELIFYYHSQLPHIYSGTDGFAPLQKFDIDLTRVYFTVSHPNKYTRTTEKRTTSSSTGSINYSGSWGDWDSRHLILQQRCSTTTSISTLPSNPLQAFGLYSYITSGSKIGNVMVVVGWDRDSKASIQTTLTEQCTPTNDNLTWVILFSNKDTSERDSNGNLMWRVIEPVKWIKSSELKIDLTKTY